ncbi:MAG TPA: response regulator [Candidatus Paceibacterota bacterium]
MKNLKNILMVSDNDDTLHTALLLGSRGHSVTAVRRGGIGIFLTTEGGEGRAPLDLVIADQNLPDRNGLEIASMISASRLNPPPSWLISEMPTEQFKAEAKQAGVTKIIPKDELVSALVKAGLLHGQSV